MDPKFIDDLISTIQDIEQTARSEFGDLDLDQLNWQPAEDSWSLGQCLDHLIKSNLPYLEIFESIQKGTKRNTIWERLPLLPDFWGGLLVKAVSPDNNKKARAPKIFTPSNDPAPADIVQRFCDQQHELIVSIESLKEFDLDKLIITSPVAPFITYSLRSALTIIVTHEQRHVNQAKNVKAQM